MQKRWSRNVLRMSKSQQTVASMDIICYSTHRPASSLSWSSMGSMGSPPPRSYAKGGAGEYRQGAGIGRFHGICGFPPAYLLLRTIDVAAGTLLKHDQAVKAATQAMVSYASVVFH